jgi:hypothetical protein
LIQVKFWEKQKHHHRGHRGTQRKAKNVTISDNLT